MFNYFTYIIESLNTKKYYIGQTNDLEIRLTRHNSGNNKSTKNGRPWKYIYEKGFNTRSEAVKHERYLKSLKSRKQLEKLTNKCAG